MSILFHSIQNREKCPLDLHDLLVRNESATFFVRIAGNSFSHFDIHEDDILVVDKSVDPSAHRFYIGIADGEFVLRESSVSEESCEYWGGVTYVIHKS